MSCCINVTYNAVIGHINSEPLYRVNSNLIARLHAHVLYIYMYYACTCTMHVHVLSAELKSIFDFYCYSNNRSA